MTPTPHGPTDGERRMHDESFIVDLDLPVPSPSTPVPSPSTPGQGRHAPDVALLLELRGKLAEASAVLPLADNVGQLEVLELDAFAAAVEWPFQHLFATIDRELRARGVETGTLVHGRVGPRCSACGFHVHLGGVLLEDDDGIAACAKSPDKLHQVDPGGLEALRGGRRS